MSIELKQAAQQAVDAFDAFSDVDDFASLFELTQKMRALRTAIQQAETRHLSEAIEALSATTREPSLTERAISSGYFGVLPVKATIPMCKAGWGCVRW